LEFQFQVQVVAEAEDNDELMDRVGTTSPDLLLLDWELPGMAPDRTLSELRRRFPNLAVIALSGRPEARQAALSAGIDGFVCKMDPPDRLLAAIHRRASRL
jgi:DNA-binding NarL/FixJ family response regulator